MVIEGLKGRRRFGVGLGGEGIAILLAQTAEDLQQLPGGVVREEQGFVEPAFQRGIAVEDPVPVPLIGRADITGFFLPVPSQGLTT